MIGFAARMTRIPAGLPSAEASPLMCAGVTTFGALKHSVAGPGDTVAILGIGGLGHMALQYARNSGFRTVAVSRGGDKKGLALELGAHVYIDAQSEDPVQILKGMGGARVILATAPDSASITRIFDGLGEGGEMIIVAGMGGSLKFAPGQFLAGRRAVRGFTGTDPADLAGTLNFSQLANIHPLIETFPLGQAAGAFDRMMSSNVRFRAVLTM
jgi:propanol-preferring alcohol dehydrogenase